LLKLQLLKPQQPLKHQLMLPPQTNHQLIPLVPSYPLSKWLKFKPKQKLKPKLKLRLRPKPLLPPKKAKSPNQ
jgi:hypothetical protein